MQSSSDYVHLNCLKIRAIDVRQVSDLILYIPVAGWSLRFAAQISSFRSLHLRSRARTRYSPYHAWILLLEVYLCRPGPDPAAWIESTRLHDPHRFACDLLRWTCPMGRWWPHIYNRECPDMGDPSFLAYRWLSDNEITTYAMTSPEVTRVGLVSNSDVITLKFKFSEAMYLRLLSSI